MIMLAKNRYTVTIKQDYKQIDTYRSPQDIFYETQKELEPFQTL